MTTTASRIGLLLGGLILASLPARAVDAPGSLAGTLAPKKLVLSVGIDKFQDPLWRGLRFARSDATSIYDYFMAKDVGFDGGELLAAEAGTKSTDVFAALDRLHVENRNEEDTVVVYLSMHGSVAYRPDGRVGRYIITTDTDSQRVAETSIDYDKLMESFQKLRSRRKVLILAFCHSGVGKSVLTPEMKRALAQLKGAYFEEPIQERSEGSIILTASGWQEPALEDEALSGDVYTHFLLEGMKQDVDGPMTVTMAHQYASERVYQYTKGRQRPSAIVELLGSDPIVVKGKPKAARSAMLYSLMRRFAELHVYVDGEPKGTLEKGLSIPEGKVRLRIEDPSSHAVVTDRVVRFAAGKEYSVASLIEPSLANSLMVGGVVQGFQGAALRTQFAPADLSGGRVRYTREEAVGVFDLGAEIAYFPGTGETIATADGKRFSQTRREGVASALLGTRERLAALSTGNGSIRTEVRAGAGPSLLYIERQVGEPAFAEAKSRCLSPGLLGSVGLDLTFPYYLMKVGLDAGAGAYRSFATTPGLAAASRQYGLSIGTFW